MRVGSEDQECDVQGHTNRGLSIESWSRIRAGPRSRSSVWSLELVLHKVVTSEVNVDFKRTTFAVPLKISTIGLKMVSSVPSCFFSSVANSFQ